MPGLHAIAYKTIYYALYNAVQTRDVRKDNIQTYTKKMISDQDKL